MTGYWDALTIQAEAYRVFERWRADYDPNGEMDILDAAVAYYAWAADNSIEPYLSKTQGIIEK